MLEQRGQTSHSNLMNLDFDFLNYMRAENFFAIKEMFNLVIALLMPNKDLNFLINY